MDKFLALFFIKNIKSSTSYKKNSEIYLDRSVDKFVREILIGQTLL
jgi:hypothetical protein